MKKTYKITAILHSGALGTRNTPRTDGRYPLRINRVVELDTRSLVVGYPLILDYILDENGSDYSNHYLRASAICDWDFIFNNRIRIETTHSIYELEAIAL